jgi:branched-chain amino acid transport system ATP-binding protein
VTPLLEVRNLSVAYGAIEAVRDVSFVVEPGQIVSLIGANGAGKTTTLRTISGLLRPRSGEILFKGRPIHKQPAHEILGNGIAHCPEGRRLFGRMTVEENLQLGAYVRRDTGVEADMKRVYDLFPVLGERRHNKAGLFSGGEQQMLAIARGLLTKPRLLMIDELSLGLAPIVIQRLLAALKEIQASGVTILLVEQFARLVLGMADVAFVLEHGSLAFAGTSQQLIDNPSVLHGAYLAGRKALQEVTTP